MLLPHLNAAEWGDPICIAASAADRFLSLDNGISSVGLSSGIGALWNESVSGDYYYQRLWYDSVAP